MSKKKSILTPEETLGKVLFVRRTVEQIVQVLNNVSDYVITNNSNLYDDVENKDKIEETLNVLNGLNEKSFKEIKQLISG